MFCIRLIRLKKYTLSIHCCTDVLTCVQTSFTISTNKYDKRNELLKRTLYFIHWIFTVFTSFNGLLLSSNKILRYLLVLTCRAKHWLFRFLSTSSFFRNNEIILFHSRRSYTTFTLLLWNFSHRRKVCIRLSP